MGRERLFSLRRLFYFPPALHDMERYYEPIALGVVETTWENRPAPHLHRYRTAANGPPLILWKRRAQTPRDAWHVAVGS